MKKFLQRSVTLLLTITICLGMVLPVHAATQRSDGKNMEKALKYCRQGKISKVRKYTKKISKISKEACVKRMSPKMKNAYRKIVEKKFNGYNGYYLTDIDNDKKADLLIQTGNSDADTKLVLYQYKKGKAVKIASIYCGNTSFHAYPNHKGIIFHRARMDHETISIVTLKNKKLTMKDILDRDSRNYLNLRCALYNHIIYDDDYNSTLDLRDLQ